MQKQKRSKIKISYSSEEEEDKNPFIPSKEQKKKKDEYIRELEVDVLKKKDQTELHLRGTTVYFPYVPYPNQIEYMTKVIETLQTGAIAGLESPTGTGKTLCLLCASLGWLAQKRKEISEGKKNLDPLFDDIKIPKIYYSSRTHSQLSGVMKELKKTCYLPRVAILSSRDNLCVHPVIKQFKGANLNAKCKIAKFKKECKYLYGAERLLPTYYDLCDIEELFELGIEKTFCPFMFERNKKDFADIIFLPYNYIFEQKFRKALRLNLNECVLIVDEAHNMTQVCEEGVSKHISTSTLEEIRKDIKEVREIISNSLHPLPADSVLLKLEPEKICIEEIIIERIKNYINLLKLKNGNNWPDIGLKLTEKELFDVIFEGSTEKYNGKQKKIDNLMERTPGITPDNLSEHISTLEKLESGITGELQKFTLLSQYIEVLELIKELSNNYMEYIETNDNNPLNNFCNNYKFFVDEVDDVEFHSQYNKNRKGNNKVLRGKTRVLHLYCFNPGFGFEKLLSQKPSSIIITSGTLSPLEGLESEIKVNFGVKLENPHVVSKEQVSLNVLHNSPFNNNIQFLFTNNNKNNMKMLQDLGKTIVELIKSPPGGVLVFFTSYTFLNSCVNTWRNNKILEEMQQYKEVYTDLREAKKNKNVIKNYTDANSSKNSKGALLFSVFRGTTSEGIDFADDFARMVILVGIPYPNLGDVKVQLKKEFLDEFCKKTNNFNKNKFLTTLRGSDWYMQCASRTINQAMGRVIRHINDYGAMVLVDTRFKDLFSKNLISKWLRGYVVHYYGNGIFYSLRAFYQQMENFVPKPVPKDNVKDKKPSSNPKLDALKQFIKRQDLYDEQREKERRKSKGSKFSNFSAYDNNLCNPNAQFQSSLSKEKQLALMSFQASSENKGNFEFQPAGKCFNKPSKTPIKEEKYKEREDNDFFLLSESELNSLLQPDKENTPVVENPFSNGNPFIGFSNNSGIGGFNNNSEPDQKNENSKVEESSNNLANSIQADFKFFLENKSKEEVDTFLQKYHLKFEQESSKSNKKQEGGNKGAVSSSEKENPPFQCPVCFNSKEEIPEIRFKSAKCGHVICESCWKSCLSLKNECPICKKKVTAKTLITLYL